jgi:hypothetical protein
MHQIKNIWALLGFPFWARCICDLLEKVPGINIVFYVIKFILSKFTHLWTHQFGCADFWPFCAGSSQGLRKVKNTAQPTRSTAFFVKVGCPLWPKYLIFILYLTY